MVAFKEKLSYKFDVDVDLRVAGLADSSLLGLWEGDDTFKDICDGGKVLSQEGIFTQWRQSGVH